MSYKVITVVGLPGVGKTTVMNLAIKKLREKGYMVKLVNFGDFMLKYLLESGIVRSRDEIRKLPLSKQREVQALVAKEIRNVFDEEFKRLGCPSKFLGIVDTHALIKTESGLWPGLPSYVIENLRPDLIVVIEATPEEIVSRQLRDRTRYRADYAKVELVKELLEFNRVFAVASAVLVGASISIVRNREGKAEEAAMYFVKVVESL